jgi:hypothetical protein
VYDDGAWTEASYWFGERSSTRAISGTGTSRAARPEVASFPGVARWSRDAA